MTVWTQVSEADVSRLRVGMPVYMTTLGDPNTRHLGKLRQILPTPEITNNVVLFDVLFDVPNPDGTLMTQMTAQVFLIVAAAENVLTVPTAALQMAQTLGRRTGAAGQRGQGGQSQGTGGQGAGRQGGAGGAVGRGGASTEAQRQAWREAHPDGRGARQFVMVVNGGQLERREVVVGVTNRVTAEIKSGVKVGEPVVVGRKQPKVATNPAARSPLQTTQPPGGGFASGRRGG